MMNLLNVIGDVIKFAFIRKVKHYEIIGHTSDGRRLMVSSDYPFWANRQQGGEV